MNKRISRRPRSRSVYCPTVLLESVPNVSEGRREAVIRRLRAAVEGVLLDLGSDADHNRSVLTLAGRGPQLERALLRLYETALEEVDLSVQRGVHPRIGAVDVVPFVPLGDTPMTEAVAAARSLGARVAERFKLPVYLYEEAATRPERRNLAEIRRGGIARLAERLTDPGWAPDFGPPRLHPRAGATVIGARRFLVAFNVELATADVRIARRIAARIREAGGGLPAVKALGLYLERLGRAQVSMNLVDFRRTSPARAVAAVRREATALGTEVVATEIIGLIPAAALADATPEELQIKNFRPELVLEERLRRSGLA